ncbi:MAG TPA: hypothetical protein DHW82_05630 [Spirochaetia bacterium]|nr:hypothetical protein [Spirochaetia bacterium]
MKKKRKIRKHRIDDDDDEVIDMTNPKSIFLLEEFVKLNDEQKTFFMQTNKKAKSFVLTFQKKWEEKCRLKEKEERA